MDNITVGDAINGVQQIYSKGAKSTASRLSSRYIYSLLLKNRATIVKQQINKKQSISQWTYQSINCIGLESVKQQYTDIILLKSVNKIPTPILGLGSESISQVTSIDRNIKFDLTDSSTFKYASGKKYTSNKPSSYIDSQYIYINFYSKLKGISIRGLFYDPIEVALFPSLCSDCSNCNCKDVTEFPFPIDGDTLNTVNKLCLNDIMIFLQMKEDKTDNSSDDIALGNQMIHKPQQEQQSDSND